MDQFPPYRDLEDPAGPTSPGEESFTFPKDGGPGTGVPSPNSPTLQSDYYKFVWQDDDDFEAALGSPSAHDYTERILSQIDSELADLHSNSYLGQGHDSGTPVPTPAPKGGDRAQVELLGGEAVRFDREPEPVAPGTHDPPGDGDSWMDREDERSTPDQFYDTYEMQPNRGKADGQSTENVPGRTTGGFDRNGNLTGPGTRGSRGSGGSSPGAGPRGSRGSGASSPEASSPGPRELRQAARDASNVRHYYHTQIAPISKDRILLPMEEVEMSYSEEEGLGDREEEEEATDDQAIYVAAEDTEFGVDYDDTRPIVMTSSHHVVVNQWDLTTRWKLKSRKWRRAMVVMGTVAVLLTFALVTYFTVHLLKAHA